MVLNGMLANQTTFNNGFMSRTDTSTSTVAVVVLNNTSDPNSGPIISNTQRALNELFGAVGVSGIGDAGANDYTTNYKVTDGESYKEAIESLDGAFKGSGGHTHTGVDGEGDQISASDLLDINKLFCEFQSITVAYAAGFTFDVSSSFFGKSPNGSASTEGVITTAPNNRVDLVSATGEYFEDAGGQKVYGRLTYTAGVWAVSFYTLEAGVETTHNFAGGSAATLYREVFNQNDRPTIPSNPFLWGTLDVTADVIDATQTLKGKVNLQNATSSAIAATGSIGTANARVATADHAHEGVHSLAIDAVVGDAKGDVLLKEGDNVTLEWDAGKIKISAQGGGIGYQEVPAGVVNGINNTFGPLTYVPINTDSVFVYLDSLVVPKAEYTVSGSNIIFNPGYLPQTGQKVYAVYLTGGAFSLPPLTGGYFKVEYRTLTGGEITAKQITLASTPATPGEVMVDVIGGGAQVPGADFAVTGAVLDWNGLGLDGLLVAGDVLRVAYIT